MKFRWQVMQATPQTLRDFLRLQGISRSLLSRLKFEDGSILVNGAPCTVRFRVQYPDEVVITLPSEKTSDKLVPSELPITVLYEDKHYLIINKPSGIASIPSHVHPFDTMANRVKGYLQRKGDNETIHIITRLDRDTTGIMLFAKHGYAQSRLVIDSQPMEKIYLAIVTHPFKGVNHDVINAPIQRVPGSAMVRMVGTAGRSAITEFWVQENFENSALVRIQLHTGRTHQIRVHFQGIGHVLVGDDLYQGKHNRYLQRQGLHCAELTFYHPFEERLIHIVCPLPADMAGYLAAERKHLHE